MIVRKLDFQFFFVYLFLSPALGDLHENKRAGKKSQLNTIATGGPTWIHANHQEDIYNGVNM